MIQYRYRKIKSKQFRQAKLIIQVTVQKGRIRKEVHAWGQDNTVMVTHNTTLNNKYKQKDMLVQNSNYLMIIGRIKER